MNVRVLGASGAEATGHQCPAFLVDGEILPDAWPTERFWERMETHDVKCLIVEVSFPDRLAPLALFTGHLTPSVLDRELAKIACRPPEIRLMHPKPQVLAEIEREIRALDNGRLRFLREGDVLTL